MERVQVAANVTAECLEALISNLETAMKECKTQNKDAKN